MGDAAGRQAMYADLMSRGIDPNSDPGYNAYLAGDWYSQPYQAVAAQAAAEPGTYWDVQCNTCYPDCHGYYPKSFLGFPSALGYKPWIGRCEPGVSPAGYAAGTYPGMATNGQGPVTNALDTVAPQTGQMMIAPRTDVLTQSAPTGVRPVTAGNTVRNVGPTSTLTQGAGADIAKQTGAAPAEEAGDKTWLYLAVAAAALFLFMGGKNQ